MIAGQQNALSVSSIFPRGRHACESRLGKRTVTVSRPANFGCWAMFVTRAGPSRRAKD